MKTGTIAISVVLASTVVAAQAEPSLPRLAVRLGEAMGAIRVGDLDGDRRTDILAVKSEAGKVGTPRGLTLVAAQERPSFPRPMVSLGEATGEIMTGDLDGDGWTDVLAVDSEAGEVRTLLARGDGGFHQAGAVATPQSNQDLLRTVRDIDGDGHLDLLRVVDTVSILHRGLGGGLLDEAIIGDIDIGGPPLFSHAVGDFDHDGRLDLVAFRLFINEFIVLPGRDDGTFGPTIVTPLPGSIFDFYRDPRIGDYNGDRLNDMLVLRQHSQEDDVFVLLSGNGDGTVSVADELELDTDCLQNPGVVQDFDLDGRDDLVVSRCGELLLLRGRLDGRLGQPIKLYDSPFFGLSLSAGDFNGDTRPDLAGESGVLTIWLGDRDGNLGPARTYNSGGPGMTVGRANGDRRDDIFFSGADSIVIAEADPAGGFPLPTVGERGDGLLIAVEDLDNDGLHDIVVVTGSPDDGIRVYLATREGRWDDGTFYASGVRMFRTAIGDLNGDRVPDIAVAGTADGAAVLLGGGDGSYRAQPVEFPEGYGSISSVRVADMDADGREDLVFGDRHRIRIHHGRGDGSFEAQPPLVPPSTGHPSNACFSDHTNTVRDVALGDFDGDGRQDIAVMLRQSCGRILLNNGDGTYENINDVRWSLDDLATGDIDGDGRLDLVASNGTRATVRLGNGDGTLAPVIGYGSGDLNTFTDFAVTDIDNDGSDEIVMTVARLLASETDQISLLKLGRDGQLALVGSYGPGAGGRIAVADLDADGRQDLVAGGGAGVVTILYNSGGSQPGEINRSR